MAAPIDGDWSGHIVSNASLNSTTYGQGTSFPSTYNTTRLFWRSDLGRMYYNKGTEGTPTWEGADVPVGTVQMYVGGVSDLPNGWLYCNGAAVSRTTYDALYAVIDGKYGVGDGSTTFNVPNYVSNFPRGAADDAGRGTTGGSSEVTLTGAESGTSAHSHSVTDPGHTHTASSRANSYSGTIFRPADANTGGQATLTTNSSTTGISVGNSSESNASESHENKPPFVDVHFIIAV